MKKNIPTYSVFLKWVTLSTLWIIFNPQQSKASHAMGADITYQCLTNDTLLIRLTVYRDCSGSALNPQQPIYLGSNSCGIADTVLLADRVSVSEVPVICPAQQALSSCAGGILPGAEEHIYEVKVLLSQQCPDWRIGWALCCRNGAITNSVVDPSDTDMYIETLLDNTIGTCNNAPEFEEQLVPYLCVGEPFQFNAGATDPDGDSLAYELVDPLDYDYNTGVSFPVPYQPGFSFNSPMSTVGGFNFDPATGQISFTPSMIQVGIVAIRVREYRNGQLIATTMRDLQMIVLPCGNQAPIIQQPTNITGGQFNGNTFSVCVGNTLTFSIDGFDPDQDNITVSSTINATPSSVPGAVQNIANGGVFFTSNFTWTPALADTGIYFFSIRAIDDGCPRPQQSSVGYRIIVRRGEILPQRIINFCPSTQDSVAPITDIPAVPNATYLWTPFTGVSNPNSPNPIIEAPLAPTTYTLVQTSPGNCPRTQTFLIQPGADIVIPDDTVEICQGDTVALPVSVVFPGAPANFTLQWAPADPSILSSPTSSAPLAYPPTDTTYVVLASTTACQYTAEIRVLVEAPPQLNAIVDPLICYGDTTLLEATGLNLDNAQLQWLPTTTLSAPNSLSTEAYPLATTTYELKATNQCGVDSAGVTVTVASPLNLNASVEDLRCTGSNDGSIDIVPIGGLAPYVYNFSPAPPTPPINGLATNLLPGTYTVTAVDQAGCLDTLIIDINEPPPLLANLDDTEDVDCFGDNTGRIEVSASGGTPDYEYSIGGPFLNNGIFPNLTANTYTVTVRDQNNCTVNIPGVVIGQPATPITLTVDSLENTSCTDSVGRISVSISGGSGFYTLFLGQDSITSGVNVFTFTDLFPSTYLVIAEDSSGCTDFESVQIVELSDPFADLDSSQDPLCFGESTGSAMISVSDGVPPYNFSFQGSPFSPLTGNTFNPTNLPAGLYSFEVQDQNNCIYGIDFILEQPDTFLFQLGAYTPPLCTGGNEGQAIFLGFGGSPPYDYQLGSTLQDSGYFDNLSAGTYPFRLIDSRGCEVTTNIDLADPPALSGFATVENISCPGAADGVLNLSATGGSPNYEFSVQGSRFVQNTSFPNLLAGTYDIVVQDDNGCRDTLTANIIEPDPLGLLPGVIENVDCFGAASGQATLIGSGGTPPYQFALTGRPFSSSNVVDSLRRGQYVILMRDANGCESDTEVAIDEPFALRGDIESQPVLCFGDSNGIAEVFMQGGTAPYTYLWTNGETGARATSLPPGNPSVTITDDNGCQYAISAEILEPPALEFDSTAQGDVTCFAGTDGFVLAIAQGGTPPYTYDWSNGDSGSSLFGIPAGDYEITVLDSNLCPLIDTLVVNQPEEILTEVEITPAICGSPSGEIFLTPSGGTGDLTVVWNVDPPVFGPRITGILGGPDIPPYLALITDENGCELQESVRLEESGEPTAFFLHAFQPIDSFLLPPKGVQFVNRSLEGIGFLWDFGDGQLSEELNPLHIYERPGTYDVTLVVFDPFFSCPDTMVRTITLLPPGAIYVPNVFSPNGDGHNDTWSPKGAGVVRAETRIYSRWGELIITLPSLAYEWDGIHPRTGGPAQEGVYVWVVNALLNDGTRFQDAGTVTLVH